MGKGFRCVGGDFGDRVRDPDVGMRDTGRKDGTLRTGQKSLVMG